MGEYLIVGIISVIVIGWFLTANKSSSTKTIAEKEQERQQKKESANLNKDTSKSGTAPSGPTSTSSQTNSIQNTQASNLKVRDKPDSQVFGEYFYPTLESNHFLRFKCLDQEFPMQMFRGLIFANKSEATDTEITKALFELNYLRKEAQLEQETLLDTAIPESVYKDKQEAIFKDLMSFKKCYMRELNLDEDAITINVSDHRSGGREMNYIALVLNK